MDGLNLAALWTNVGVFIATAGAGAVAWWQAVEASRSKADARRAEQAALTAWQEASAALLRANDISGYAMRAPFAHALHDMATALASARFAGGDREKLIQMTLDRIHDLTEKQFAAGDVPSALIVQWASKYPRLGDIGVEDGTRNRDIDRYYEATRLIRERITLWLRDPVAGEQAVRDDPLAPDILES